MKTKATLAILVIFSLMLSLLGSPVLASDRHEGSNRSDSESRHTSWFDRGDRGYYGGDDQDHERDDEDSENHGQPDGSLPPTVPPTTPPVVPPTTPPVVPPTTPPVVPPTTPPVVPPTTPPVVPPTTPPVVPPTTPPPAPVLTPPAATTVAASSITTSGAILNGNLAGLGTAASVNVSFQYGLTTAYGSVTTAQARSATGTFSAGIAGLAQNTLYHFRVVATGDGTVYGADQTFTTGRALTAPLVTTSGVAGVDTSSASLLGNLTSLGTATSATVVFEWGTSTAYGNTTAAQVRTGTGSFSISLSSLSPDTTYYFRAKATGDGAATGAGQSFATDALPPPPPPPPPPPAPSLPTTPTTGNGLIPVHFTLPEYQGFCTSCH